MGKTDLTVFTQIDDLDFPDTEDYCRKVIDHLRFTNYHFVHSDVSALEQLAQNDGEEISGTFSHVYKRFVTERGHDGVIMGLRAEESHGRRQLRKIRGKIYQKNDGQTSCIPIADWSGEDVFALICATNTPYMHVYDCDDYLKPHEIRFSWMVSPQFYGRGQVAFLKQYYPEQFNRLAMIQPALQRHT